MERSVTVTSFLIALISLINGQPFDPSKVIVLSAPRGIVTSPGYDGKTDYPGSQTVRWLIASQYPYVSFVILNEN